MRQSIVFAIAFLAASTQFEFARNPQQSPNSRTSILDEQMKSETVRIRLLDAFLGKVIANSAVDLSSVNTVFCRQAPCPSNANQSRLKSDANGFVIIPTDILNVSTHISAPGYRKQTDLIGGAQEDIGFWVVGLIPNQTSDGSGPQLDCLKLIDARSNRPLANRRVYLSFDGSVALKGKTNSLGYVFFPVDKSKGVGSVVVNGYRRTEFDRKAVAYNYYHYETDNYRIKLEKP